MQITEYDCTPDLVKDDSLLQNTYTFDIDSSGSSVETIPFMTANVV